MDQATDILNRFVNATLSIAIEASPWLLLGLLFAGIIRAWMPERTVARWLGGSSVWSVVRAAIIGTPLPLCSCGVVPAAMGLRQAGASKPSTVSFLVATPENGADSIALSYALLGPVFALARIISALVCAIGAGLIALFVVRRTNDVSLPLSPAPDSCCEHSTPACCSSTSGADETPTRPGAKDRLGEGVLYALSNLLDDLGKWLVIGLLVSGAVLAFVPQGLLEEWGSGPLAMVVMALVGVPMYICATAATPIAASLLSAGVGPGAVLVLLLAGPATNIGTIGIVRRELGHGAMVAYLFGVILLAIGCGIALEWTIDALGLGVGTDRRESAHGHVFPPAIGAAALSILIAFGVPPIRRAMFRRVGISV